MYKIWQILFGPSIYGVKAPFLGVLLFFAANCQINAQLNISIGYGIGFLNANVNNDILDAFNSRKGQEIDLDNPFGHLKSMSGISIGGRYKLGTNAFGFVWDNMSKSRRAFGETTQMTLFDQELFYSFNMVSFNYESNFGRIGIGSSVGKNFLKIKDEIPNSPEKNTLVKESQYFARINLSFNFSGGGTVAFALKPYIQFPLSELDISGLATELDVAIDKQDESFPFIGLSFVFYNGR